jgi:hypothetical protein
LKSIKDDKKRVRNSVYKAIRNIFYYRKFESVELATMLILELSDKEIYDITNYIKDNCGGKKGKENFESLIKEYYTSEDSIKYDRPIPLTM